MRSRMTEAVAALADGGVIVYPTDTVYGLGADATNSEAVVLVRTIKGREEDKPILAMVSDMATLEEYAEVTPLAQELAEKFLPGALTLILTMRGTALTSIAGRDDAVGFRIPAHPTCLELCRLFGKPITSTSVNRSGLPQAHTVIDMLTQLGGATKHISVVIDEGELIKSPPSTILDVRGNKAILVREGAIPTSTLQRFLL